MKKSDIKRVVRITLITAFCALLFFIIVLFISKWLDENYASNEFGDITPGAESDRINPKEVATELIFVKNGDELAGIYLAEIDCINVRWRLTVIPLDTRLTLSTELYKECVKSNVSAPQITTAGELYKFFSEARATEILQLAMGEVLPFKPDYVLNMPNEVFAGIFRENPEKYSYAYFLADGFSGQITEAGGMKKYMTNVLSQCTGTLTLKQQLFYLETFEDLTNLRVSCRLIPGERHNNGYVIDVTTADFY